MRGGLGAAPALPGSFLVFRALAPAPSPRAVPLTAAPGAPVPVRLEPLGLVTASPTVCPSQSRGAEAGAGQGPGLPGGHRPCWSHWVLMAGILSSQSWWSCAVWRWILFQTKVAASREPPRISLRHGFWCLRAPPLLPSECPRLPVIVGLLVLEPHTGGTLWCMVLCARYFPSGMLPERSLWLCTAGLHSSSRLWFPGAMQPLSSRWGMCPLGARDGGCVPLGAQDGE